VEHDDLANYLGFAEVALYNVSFGSRFGRKLICRCISIIILKVS
jgi:hypothetical protein